MTVWMVYPRYVAESKDNAFAWLRQEAHRCGVELRVVVAEELMVEYGPGAALWLSGERIEVTRLAGAGGAGAGVAVMPDVVVMRTYSTVLSRHFESRGVRVVNTTASMELCLNKMLTHEILTAGGIPTPATLYVEGGEYDYDVVAEILGGGRFVVKRIDGAKGDHVYLVDTAAGMREAVERCGGRCVCQQFVESSYGRDVRVWVVGGEAVACVLRRSAGDFRSNFSLGGTSESFDLPPEAAAMCVEACRRLGVEFAGVDLLFGRDGFLVNEVNGNAGFRTLSAVGENNIPARLFEYVAKLT